MTPLESIREGIMKGDIALVIDGYNRITNENIQLPQRRAVPEPPRNRPRAAESFEMQRHPEDMDGGYTDEPDHSGRKMEVAARPEPFVRKKRINMFADEQEELPDYTEADEKADAAAKRKRKTQRPAPYTPKQVSCASCGKLYQVNPIFVVAGVYNCDRCTNSRR